MSKLWQGRTDSQVADIIDAINRSIAFDQKLYPYDIQGSIAHVTMLGNEGIITADDAQQITQTLQQIRVELDEGVLTIPHDVEDIHTFVEMELTQRIGDTGKKLHTGRSRNDQVALDLRLYLRDALQAVVSDIDALQTELQTLANQHTDTIMPGYTHLQRAQPVTLALHLQAYIEMTTRDKARIQDALKRVNQSPLGAGALAGSTFPVNRRDVATMLSMDGILVNPMDAVSSRDFVVETLSCLSILMMHLSRFSEDLILWNSQEFGFITFADAHTTGSSMMPQKKNPDVAELVRGKTGRVYGHLMALLTTLKALPMTYNKDLQEDKEAVFDALDTVHLSLKTLTLLVSGMTPNTDTMRTAAQTGFLNATDLADYLVRQGLPFRDAYKLVGQAVALCLEHHCSLEALPFETYQGLSSVFQPDLYTHLSLEACIEKRR